MADLYPASVTEQLKDADWVTKMREHFAQSGFFRPEDVARLLGDPLQHADAGLDGGRRIR
jgi:hypothetical protein